MLRNTKPKPKLYLLELHIGFYGTFYGTVLPVLHCPTPVVVLHRIPLYDRECLWQTWTRVQKYSWDKIHFTLCCCLMLSLVVCQPVSCLLLGDGFVQWVQPPNYFALVIILLFLLYCLLLQIASLPLLGLTCPTARSISVSILYVAVCVISPVYQVYVVLLRNNTGTHMPRFVTCYFLFWQTTSSPLLTGSACPIPSRWPCCSSSQSTAAQIGES